MDSELQHKWRLAGGDSPDHWTFATIESLLANSKSIAVGVMYPGEHTRDGIPLIKVADIKNGLVTGIPEYLISKDKDFEYRRTKLQGDELLITLVGNPGDCVIVTEDMAGWNVARAVAVLRLNEPKLRAWVRYALLSPPAQHFLSSRFNTTVQKTLTLKDIRELFLPFPPERDRAEIASIIDTINNKIAVNRQMNTTLESMAQALFKSWFVDFDPVIDKALAAGNPIPEPLHARAEARKALGDQRKPLPASIQQQFPDRFVFTEEMGWVPEGWEVASIGSKIELAYGKSLSVSKRVPGLIPVYGSGGATGLHSTALVEGPGIVVGRKGTVGSLYWVEKDFFPIDTVFYVVNNSGLPLYWIYEALQLLDIKSMGADSAVPGVNRNVIYSKKMVLPKLQALEEYTKQISAITSRKKTVDAANEALITLRDILLPKLLSGELRIPEG